MDRQRYLQYLTAAFANTVAETLHTLPPRINYVVIGGRAINRMVRKRYQVPSYDWDFHVWDVKYEHEPTSPKHRCARDKFLQIMEDYLRGALDMLAPRIGVVNEMFNVDQLSLSCIHHDFTLVGYDGFRYDLAQLSFLTDKFAPIPYVDATARPHPGDIISINQVNYMSPRSLLRVLANMIRILGHQKMARNRKRYALALTAAHRGDLSCNYYRTINKLPAIARCVFNTAMGPLDLSVPSSYRQFPRYVIARGDIRAHSRYLLSLSREDQRIVHDYTLGKYVQYNMLLLQKQITPNLRVQLPAELRRLQEIILAAPPLNYPALVYRVSRVVPHLDEAMKVGDTVAQITFTATTFDNQANFRPFVDYSSSCCAFVVKLPPGSHCLVLGALSAYPTEAEVLLPRFAQFKVDDITIGNVTHSTDSAIVYEEMAIYNVTYKSIHNTAAGPPEFFESQYLNALETASK